MTSDGVDGLDRSNRRSDSLVSLTSLVSSATFPVIGIRNRRVDFERYCYSGGLKPTQLQLYFTTGAERRSRLVVTSCAVAERDSWHGSVPAFFWGGLGEDWSNDQRREMLRETAAFSETVIEADCLGSRTAFRTFRHRVHPLEIAVPMLEVGPGRYGVACWRAHHGSILPSLCRVDLPMVGQWSST